MPMITDKDRTEKEKRLAELLGWKIKCVGDVATGWYDSAGNYQSMCPAWTRDWSACGPLMAEHDIQIEYSGKCLAAFNRFLPSSFAEYDAHPTKESAVMYATVCAVIAKLEAVRPA